jgi:hypothetical protein
MSEMKYQGEQAGVAVAAVLPLSIEDDAVSVARLAASLRLLSTRDPEAFAAVMVLISRMTVDK